jgi:N-glycosylase/DNA lyase
MFKGDRLKVMNNIGVASAFKTVVIPINDIDLDATFDCGQCFRFERQIDGSWSGVAFSQSVNVRYEDGLLIITGTGGASSEKIWHSYFDIDRDYLEIKHSLSSDAVLKRAIAYAWGIRVLHQEPWEALCSFIISQNNNIPRIKGIISRLCENFGQKLEDGTYAFPSPQTLCELSIDDLAPLRSGFRAKYIIDAAKKVSLGEVNLETLSKMTVEAARAELIKIKGVGAKVADCTLLFGCGRIDCFPIDVWIKRVLTCFYPDGFPIEFAPFGGIAQQYLFHYARCCPECELNRHE